MADLEAAFYYLSGAQGTGSFLDQSYTYPDDEDDDCVVYAKGQSSKEPQKDNGKPSMEDQHSGSPEAGSPEQDPPPESANQIIKKRTRTSSQSSLVELFKRVTGNSKQKLQQQSSKDKISSSKRLKSANFKLTPDMSSASSKHNVEPIFVISILPHTCLPAHTFQHQLPPLSPHHYPPMSSRWPILCPPLSLYAKNLYVKKYTKNQLQHHQNTYLPVHYCKDHLKSLQELAEKDALLHPTISKIWRSLQLEIPLQQSQKNAENVDHESSFNCIDAVDSIRFESSYNNLVGSFYGLPTSDILTYSSAKTNKPEVENHSSTSSVASDLEDGKPISNVLQPHLGGGLHLFSTQAGTLHGTDIGGEFTKLPLQSEYSSKYNLVNELMVCCSVLQEAPFHYYYTTTVMCWGYFGEASCDALPLQRKEEGSTVKKTTTEQDIKKILQEVSDDFNVDNCSNDLVDKSGPLGGSLNDKTLKIVTCDGDLLKFDAVTTDDDHDIPDVDKNSSAVLIVSAGGVDGTEDSELLAADGGGHPSTGGGAVDLPAIRKKERDYMGMFEYDKKDELSIIKTLIYELKPRVAVSQLPGLPAYILFMCIRHTDHLNDDEKVRSLMNNTVIGIKRLIKKRQNDLDSTVLWLSNTLRLLHNLKQYSGDKAFQLENTPKQNEQSLKNFDLSEYRQVLSDIAVWIYTAVIKLIEESLQPLVVPSILEHDAIPGLSGNKPAGMRGRTRSTSRGQESPVEPQKALDLLLNELTLFYRTLAMFGTDPELITQVFRQIFYYICAGALNNLLLRKDMCHWSKGMQIRYNVSNLEQWARDTRLQDLDTSETLAPIIQAAQLLQHRKTEEDVDSICEMCDKLTVPQIIKILNLYTPADDFEENVPASFIQKIQQKLQERQATQQGQGTLLMNTKFAYPVRFPFNPSSICLEDIELPDSLNLTMLRKV